MSDRPIRPIRGAALLFAMFLALAFAGPARAQAPGLVAEYGFTEGAGATVADSSGNNNTGAINGATWTTSGRYGNALDFNGASASVTIPNAASLGLTSQMTLEAWVYPTTALTGWKAVIAKNTDRFYLMASSDTASRPVIGGTWASGNPNVYGPSALPVNTWTHLAATYDGATIRLYVNGAQVASQAQTGALTTSTGTLQIGADAYAGENFAGRLDEVRIYNRALNATEIQTDMNTPVGGTPPPPDTTPPTVAVTAPGSGATVSGTISVTATAGDNVGVAGVQFLLDGASLGAEQTASPYSVSWSSTGAANGGHTLSARARDAAGNTTLATNVPVTVSNSVPTGGLVAAYSFAEGAGTTVTDSSGNSNTGTISGATWTTSGRYNNALVFNGTNAVVNVPNAASLGVTTQMTLEAWVYPTSAPTGWRAVLAKNTDRYYLMASSDLGNRPVIGGTWASGNPNVVAPSVLAVNAWTHLAATYDGTMIRLYVNGAQVAAQAQTGSLTTSTGTLQIGGDAYPGENFAGRIDEVRIYSRALSATEIQADMNTPVGGTPPPDTTPPSVVISTPTSSPTYSTNASPMTAGGTAADNVGVTQVTWANDRGGSGTATGTTSWSASGIALQPGANVLTITATDAAANPGSATLTVSYDPTPPTVAITSPTTDTTYTTNASPIALGGTAGDNIAVTQVTWTNDRGGSGTATGTTGWSVSAITLQPGANVLTVTARDAANNTAVKTLTVTYTAPDTTPPTVAVTTPVSGTTYATNATPLTIGGTSADNVGVTQVTWVNDRGGSGTATGTTSWSASGIPLLIGTNVLTITARDAANNPGTATLTVTYDNIVPTVSMTAPSAGATVSGSITVTATASDNVGVAGVQFLLDGASLGTEQTATPYSISWNTGAVGNGAHVLSARARDASGNSTVATNVSVTVSNSQATGLVAAYGFAEGAGTTASDTSGNNNNGAISGATWTTSGRYGNALVFNGTSAVVTVPNAASLGLSTRMTLEAWVYPTSAPTGWRAVMAKNTDRYYLMASSDTGNRPVVGGTFTSGNQNTYGPSALPVNTWTHLAATYDGAFVRLYVNGVQVSSQAQTTSLSASSGTLQIGGDAYAGENFAGRIDEVRIYSRALTATEIQNDMNTPIGGTPPPPDTTPPAVAISAPSAGSQVFNLVTIAANASDNVGIAGVRFFVDGTQVGSEVVSAPYAVSWNAGAASQGTHTLTAIARDFNNNSTTSLPVAVSVVATTPALVGQWGSLFSWPIVAVNTSLLPTGEVLTYDGQDLGHDARLWNPTTGVFTSVTNTNTNMFCSGQCQLADGRTLVAGGHQITHWGLKDTNIYNPTTKTWTLTGQMKSPRWYPTVTTLGDGRVLVTAGEINCSGCDAPNPEIYNPATGVWTELSSAPLVLPYYPHMYVLPDGRVLAASTSEHPIMTYTLNTATQTWTVIDSNPVDGGSSAMYLPNKIMKTGTSVNPDDPVIPSAANTYVLDMTQPTPRWVATPSMAYPRTYHTLTILPDGDVLVTGGGTTSNAIGVATAVMPAEIWSPQTQTWTTVASMNAPRLYHSNALLMPDARVLVLGGGRFNGNSEPTDQLSAQYYSPPYLFNGTRPTISSAPTAITYGSNFTVQTPQAANIAAVSFIRLGAVTHTINMDQRLVPLSFTAGAGSLSVQAPVNGNLAPPGYYMLFILNSNGVPSVAAIIKIS